MTQADLPSFNFSNGTLYVSGRITSDKVPLFRDYFEQFVLVPRDQLQLDFSHCTVFSTGGVPHLLGFISRAKDQKMTLSIKMGTALRKACTIASVIPAIKRLDPDV